MKAGLSSLIFLCFGYNKLYQAGRQSHAKIARDLRPAVNKLSAVWLPVASKFPLTLFMVHATGGQAGTIRIWQTLGYNLHATSSR